MISVAIDGPSGAGKSTLSRKLAADLGFVYVDTGAMYRAIGLYVLRKGTDPADAGAVVALLPEITLKAKPVEGGQRMLLNGEDVTETVRREEVGLAASKVSKISAVRAFLLQMQRDMAKTDNVLMDGRDIGTVVLPDAKVKIFLTAAPEMRARRRFLELQQKGENKPYEDVLADVKARDEQDMNRAEAPLRQAEDAVLLDTTNLNFDESFARMKEIVLDRGGLR